MAGRGSQPVVTARAAVQVALLEHRQGVTVHRVELTFARRYILPTADALSSDRSEAPALTADLICALPLHFWPKRPRMLQRASLRRRNLWQQREPVEEFQQVALVRAFERLHDHPCGLRITALFDQRCRIVDNWAASTVGTPSCITLLRLNSRERPARRLRSGPNVSRWLPTEGALVARRIRADS